MRAGLILLAMVLFGGCDNSCTELRDSYTLTVQLIDAARAAVRPLRGKLIEPRAEPVVFECSGESAICADSTLRFSQLTGAESFELEVQAADGLSFRGTVTPDYQRNRIGTLHCLRTIATADTTLTLR